MGPLLADPWTPLARHGADRTAKTPVHERRHMARVAGPGVGACSSSMSTGACVPKPVRFKRQLLAEPGMTHEVFHGCAEVHA